MQNQSLTFYLFLLALPDVEEEEAAGGEDDAVGLGAGGRGGHHPPLLVPGVARLGAAVRLAVEGQGLVPGHDLGLGVLRDVRRPLPP